MKFIVFISVSVIIIVVSLFGGYAGYTVDGYQHGIPAKFILEDKDYTESEFGAEVVFAYWSEQSPAVRFYLLVYNAIGFWMDMIFIDIDGVPFWINMFFYLLGGVWILFLVLIIRGV